MSVRTGFDTGFFVQLAERRADVVGLWQEAASGARDGVVSALTLFELVRLGLRGVLPREWTDQALLSIPSVCEVVWLDGVELLRRGAQLSQGHALAAVDALILASLLDSGCREIYTSDPDLARYKRSDLRIVLL